MGGHGGLNILPQKSWNVYGRENRLKVARDEAKHAAEQEELRQRHEAAERQYRHSVLLQRAQQREGGGTGDAGDGGVTGDVVVSDRAWGGDGNEGAEDEGDLRSRSGLGAEVQQPWQRKQQQLLLQQQQQQQQQQFDAGGGRRKRRRLDAAAEAAVAATIPAAGGDAAGAGEEEEGSDGVGELRHINFWEEQEGKAQHPERKEEQKEQLRKRGNPDTHTSDARFDESFRLGHNMAAAQQPWYARKLAPQPNAPQPSTSGRQHAAPAPAAIALGTTAAALQPLEGVAADAEIARLLKSVTRQQSSRSKRRRAYSSSSDGSGSSSSDGGSSSSDEPSKHEGRRRSDHKRRRHSQRHSSDKTHDEVRSDDGGDSSDASGVQRQHGRSGSRDNRNSSKHRSSSRKHKSGSKHSSDGKRSKESSKHKRRNGSKERHGSKEHHQQKDQEEHAERRRKELQAQLHVLLGQRKSVEQLRAERLEREQQERARAEAVKAGLQGGPKGYRTGYGFANELKRQRQIQ